MRVLPTDAQIYPTSAGADLEELVIGIEVEPRTTAQGITAIALTAQRGDVPLASVTLEGDAVARGMETSLDHPTRVTWRDLCLRLPATLAADRLRIELRGEGRALLARELPLVRYQQPVELRLPVAGCWLVSSGHALGLEHRRHYNRAHFGWDLVRVDGNGDPAAGPALTDHFSFGAPVLAPAPGTILLADDRHLDRAPGDPGSTDEANYVLIQHADDLFAKLAHLRQGSLRVRPGDHVEAGQVVAQVGNSGQSDAPHLHVHFQGLVRDATGAIVEEPPLPALFSGYTVTSNLGVRRSVTRGDPRRGEFVCAPP
jgi:hypothetical protein